MSCPGGHGTSSTTLAPPSERLKLLEEIWDSLAPEDVPVPDWHKEELDRRLDRPEPGPGLTWDQVRAKLDDPKGS